MPILLTLSSNFPSEMRMLHSLWDGLRRLSVGFVLLIVAAAILLYEARRQRDLAEHI